MANLIYQNDEAAITWQDASGTNVITLNNLGTGAGRQGALHDFGTAARAHRFAWRAHVEFDTTPVVGEQVDVYLKTSDGTHPDNDDGTGDAAVSAEDKLKNLHYLGSIIVDEAATSVEMVASGIVEIGAQHAAPVFWNATADNLENVNNTSGFQLTPIPLEVQ